MMKTVCSLPATWLPLLVPGSLLLLSACTPTAAGPSAALKQQFAQIQQQQQQQAEQLNVLQQQLDQLLQQTPGSVPTSFLSQSSQHENSKMIVNQPATIPAAISQEVSALADSASNYLAAFSNLAAGRYGIAETGFNNFLTEYPEHQYTSNARYWLASAQLSQGKLQLASSNLRQVIVDLNSQERAPAALVLLAKVYQQQQLNNEADEVLEQLRIHYPDSSEAQQFLQEVEPQQPL